MKDRFEFRQPVKCAMCGNIEFYIFSCHDGYRSGAVMQQHNNFASCCKTPDYHIHKESEQCTGLKDKNGKLYWENDKVKRGNTKHIGQVICHKGKWCIKWLSGVYYEYPRDIADYKTLEIIGNIHEDKL
jgi:hypothetical protein